MKAKTLKGMFFVALFFYTVDERWVSREYRASLHACVLIS
jgi:hypothetical protein